MEGLSGSGSALLLPGAAAKLTVSAVVAPFEVTAQALTASSMFLTCWAPRSVNARGRIFLT